MAQDECDASVLTHALWPLCERLSARLKRASLAAGTITLKLKTADFRLRTRSRRLDDPTQLADTLFHIASGLLAAETDGGTRFRLVGVGADNLVDSRDADPPTLFDRELTARDASNMRSTRSAASSARKRSNLAAPSRSTKTAVSSPAQLTVRPS